MFGKVPNGLSKQEELQARMIRDADKIDIYYALTTQPIEDVYCTSTMENDTIKEEIMDQAINNHYIDYNTRDTAAEILISHLIMVYDINYKSSLQIIKQNEYITKLANRFKFHNEDTYKKVQECSNIVNQYLEEKTK